jgi:hypothetical protein
MLPWFLICFCRQLSLFLPLVVLDGRVSLLCYILFQERSQNSTNFILSCRGLAGACEPLLWYLFRCFLGNILARFPRVCEHGRSLVLLYRDCALLYTHAWAGQRFLADECARGALDNDRVPLWKPLASHFVKDLLSDRSFWLC